MTVRLSKKSARFLLGQPESGMDYQRVDVRLANNREIREELRFASAF